MSPKNALWILISGVALVACGERPRPDAGTDAGCIGACGNKDGGTDGGTKTDGGTVLHGRDGGLSLADLRNLPADGTVYNITDVVVRYTPYWRFQLYGSNQTPENRGEFWISDPYDADGGFWVNKYWTDNPVAYAIDAGDLLDISAPLIAEGATYDQYGYRTKLGSATGTARMTITVKGSIPLPGPKEMTAADFADSDGGRVAARRDIAGAYVHIAGPLELTNATPPVLWTQHYKPDGSYDFYNGFEVTGGIPVVDSETYSGCNYGEYVRDGGHVTFADGVSGIWDTYTMSPCPAGWLPALQADGGFNSSCGTSHLAGYVPASDAGQGELQYTYVLYPLNCSVDLDGGLTP